MVFLYLRSFLLTSNNPLYHSKSLIYIYLTTTDTNIASASAQVTSSNIRTGRSYKVYLGGSEDFSDEEAAGTSYWSNGYIKTIVIEFADDTTT